MTNPTPPSASTDSERYKPFLEQGDLPKVRIDNKKVKLLANAFKHARLGRRYNGKHND